MTRDGVLFELPTPELPTVESASSSLLPTPTAQQDGSASDLNKRQARVNAAKAKHGRIFGKTLEVSVALLPTPVVNDMGAGKTPDERDAWTERMRAEHGNGNGHGKSLEIEAQRLLPTPRTTDANGAGAHGAGGPDLRTAVQLLPTPCARDYKQTGAPSEFDRNTPTLVTRFLPTATSMDSKASGGSSPSDVTLTDAVVRTSLGALTNPRFDAGSTSSDAEPHGQLSLDVPESA